MHVCTYAHILFEYTSVLIVCTSATLKFLHKIQSNQSLICYQMLVEQFRITDLYHPRTKPLFLMLVRSPILVLMYPALCTRATECDPIQAPVDRTAVKQKVVHVKVVHARPRYKYSANVINSNMRALFSAPHMTPSGHAQAGCAQRTHVANDLNHFDSLSIVSI